MGRYSIQLLKMGTTYGPLCFHRAFRRSSPPALTVCPVLRLPIQTRIIFGIVNDAAAMGSNGTETVSDNARTSLATRKMLLAFQHAIGAPERAPFPVIVALHGHVIGLGVDIIGACDIRYAASNASFSIKVRTMHIVPYEQSEMEYSCRRLTLVLRQTLGRLLSSRRSLGTSRYCAS